MCDVGHKRLLNWWTKGKVTGLSGLFFLLFGDYRHANEMTELLTEGIKQLRKKSKRKTAVCFCGLLRSPNSVFPGWLSFKLCIFNFKLIGDEP